MDTIIGALFDLDGVLVDTAKYHFQAWQRLALTLGIDFTERDNEALKGVSRMRSLDILLGPGGVRCSESEKYKLAEMKNGWYVESLRAIDSGALLPGAVEYLDFLRIKGFGIALGSASKNARFILKRLGIEDKFDGIIDGNCVEKVKPDPEVFVKGAELLSLRNSECMVFEDSLAGIQAAKNCGMYAIAVGSPDVLSGADRYITSLRDMLVD